MKKWFITLLIMVFNVYAQYDFNENFDPTIDDYFPGDYYESIYDDLGETDTDEKDIFDGSRNPCINDGCGIAK